MRAQMAPPAHYPWLFERSGCVPTMHFRAIEAVDDAGNIRGMIGFDNWTENSVQMHQAIDSPIVARALLGPAFSYVFEQGGRSIAVGLIPAHNVQALKVTAHYGFRETYRIKDGFKNGIDLVLMEMRRDECRWLRRRMRKAA